jgi:xanthine dehydrogenase accessory factor
VANLPLMNIWKFIENKLQHDQKIMLLFVVESIGSSPGRQGFKMAVASDDSFSGTIGGGIMEFKLVEKAKSLLNQNSNTIFLQEQFHDKEQSKNQSGMICSGSQTIAFIPLNPNDINIVQEIIQQKKSTVAISSKGIDCNNDEPKGFEFIDETNWKYSEYIKKQQVIHIIGGGHCSLALSELMLFLHFEVHVYDDRENLSTIIENKFANKIHYVDYSNISESLTANSNDYVVIMTVGYRTDKIVLKQLIHQQYKYLGLLGSAKKIETLFKELIDEGINEFKLEKIHSPVGLNINSKTTQEIAVSIAAEIIAIKNTAS